MLSLATSVRVECFPIFCPGTCQRGTGIRVDQDREPGLSLIVNFPETASGEGASSTGETRQILGDLSCSFLHGVMKSRTLVGRKQIESAHRLQRFLGQGFEISCLASSFLTPGSPNSSWNFR